MIPVVGVWKKRLVFASMVVAVFAGVWIYRDTYSANVIRIQRVLSDKWVFHVYENGHWIEAIPRPCGTAAIEYAKAHGGYVVVGYYHRPGLCDKHHAACFHVMVSREPIEPGTVVSENDPRIVFGKGDPKAVDDVMVTNVFSPRGDPIVAKGRPSVPKPRRRG